MKLNSFWRSFAGKPILQRSMLTLRPPIRLVRNKTISERKRYSSIPLDAWESKTAEGIQIYFFKPGFYWKSTVT